MSVTELSGLIILGFLWGAQLRLRSFAFTRRWLIAGVSAAVILGGALLLIGAQYEAWATDPLSRFLLPPHQSWSYFLLYVGRRFLAPWLIAASAAILMGMIAHLTNKRFSERFFEAEEPFLFGIATFLTGYPALLWYIGFMIGGGTLLSIIYAIRGKGRAPLYHLWLPVAIFAILITHFAIDAGLTVKFNL